MASHPPCLTAWLNASGCSLFFSLYVYRPEQSSTSMWWSACSLLQGRSLMTVNTWKTRVAGWICLAPPRLPPPLGPPISLTNSNVVLIGDACLASTTLNHDKGLCTTAGIYLLACLVLLVNSPPRHDQDQHALPPQAAAAVTSINQTRQCACVHENTNLCVCPGAL